MNVQTRQENLAVDLQSPQSLEAPKPREELAALLNDSDLHNDADALAPTPVSSNTAPKTKYRFTIKTTSGSRIFPSELAAQEGLPQYGPLLSPLEVLEQVVSQVKIPFVLTIETEGGAGAIDDLSLEEWQKIHEIIRNNYFYVRFNFQTKFDLDDYINQEKAHFKKLKALDLNNLNNTKLKNTYEEVKELNERRKKLALLDNIQEVCARNLGLAKRSQKTVQNVAQEMRQKAANMQPAADAKCWGQSVISSTLLTGSLFAFLLFIFPPIAPLAFAIGAIALPINYWLEKRLYNKKIAKIEKYAAALESGDPVEQEEESGFWQTIGGFFVDFSPAFSLLIGIIGLAVSPLSFMPFWGFMLAGVGLAGASGYLQIKIDEDVEKLEADVEALRNMCYMQSDLFLRPTHINAKDMDFIDSLRAQQLHISVERYKQLYEMATNTLKPNPKGLQEIQQSANKITAGEKLGYKLMAGIVGATCGASAYAALIPSLAIGLLGLTLTPVGWAIIGLAIAASLVMAVVIAVKYYNTAVKAANDKIQTTNKIANEAINILQQGGRCDLSSIKTTKSTATESRGFFGRLISNPVTTNVLLGTLGLATAILFVVFWPAAVVAGIAAIAYYFCARHTRLAMKARVNTANTIQQKVMAEIKEQYKNDATPQARKTLDSAHGLTSTDKTPTSFATITRSSENASTEFRLPTPAPILVAKKSSGHSDEQEPIRDTSTHGQPEQTSRNVSATSAGLEADSHTAATKAHSASSSTQQQHDLITSMGGPTKICASGT